MAADRGRDLQFRVLSDLSDLDLETGARQLDDLGDAGKTAGEKLSDGLDAGKRSLDDLGDKASTVGRQVANDLDPATRATDDLGDKARSVATRVTQAFEDIRRSSRQNIGKVDDDLEDAARGLDDFKEEAAGSGREAAASFGGGFDDVTSFVQETAANAFAGFGPLGAAAGVAAALGIGVITKAFGDSKEKAQEARDAVSDWIQAYVDGLGTIKEATIEANLSKFAEDGGKQLRELGQSARDAGVDVADYQRAVAGDVEAQRRVAAQYQAAFKRLRELSSQRGADQAAIGKQSAALQTVAGKLGYTNTQMAEGKARADELRAALNRPISANIAVGIDIPSPAELDAVNRRVRSGIGRIVIPLETGQNPYTNNANNSRYRY